MRLSIIPDFRPNRCVMGLLGRFLPPLRKRAATGAHEFDTLCTALDIRHAAGQIHPNTGAGADHAASTARIKAVSATRSSVLSKSKLRPSRRRNSTTIGGGTSATGGCATGTPAATGISNGKKSAPASGDYKPFFFSSCRQA